jgi:hypothetical protein
MGWEIKFIETKECGCKTITKEHDFFNDTMETEFMCETCSKKANQVECIRCHKITDKEYRDDLEPYKTCAECREKKKKLLEKSK